jgi:hypothetical protein
MLSPMEFYEAVKDWAWNPVTGHTPPVLPRAPFSSTIPELLPEFSIHEHVHYMTWGLQQGIIMQIFKPGEGYNPRDSTETLYLIERPASSPLLVPAHLLRKISPSAITCTPNQHDCTRLYNGRRRRR